MSPKVSNLDTFESFYTKDMYKQAFNYATTLTRNPESAADVLQDAVIKAYTFFSKFDKNRSFKNWFFAILKQSFIDSKRKKSSTEVLFSDAFNRNDSNIEDTLIVQVQEFYDQMFYLLFLHYLRNDVGLMEGEKRILNKYLIEDYDLTDLCDMMNINKKTLKSRVYRFRLRLKEILSS